ncbi:MAG: IS1380 family transposase [Myxococcota bacterium]
MSDRVDATPYGGVGLAQRMAERSGLMEAIGRKVRVLKQRQPYSEADHVMNIALNALCGGTCLEDLKRRKHDAAYLEMLGTLALPDSTTAGDFCRRFDAAGVDALQDAINEARLNVWRAQGDDFVAKTAILDIDSTIVETTGECKEGADPTYKGVWGYHPLLVTYANTQEPLFITNRSGARPSVEGAPALLDKAIQLCRDAGHTKIRMRGDTAFSMTRYLDRWHEDGVHFVFGLMANPSMVSDAEALEDDDLYTQFVRTADEARQSSTRARQPRVKQQVVEERGYKDLQLVREDIVEFPHKPERAAYAYRVIALRKTILEYRGQRCIDQLHRYFFYITNDPSLTAEQVVREANQRCAQEKLIGELKSGVRALRAPLNTLLANHAFMVATSIAWSLKTWLALTVPVLPRWRAKHLTGRNRMLRMSFRSFVQELMLLPVQATRSGRRLILRVLGWRPSLRTFFRLAEALGFA